MKYDIEKLIDILVILAKDGQEMTKLRINKLLYFIDKWHLQKYGRLVLNDRYCRLELGPIPSVSYNILNDFFMPTIKISRKIKQHNRLKDYFAPDKTTRGYESLSLKNESDFGSLSESEMEIIAEVLKRLGKKTTGAIVNLSHKDKAWTETEEPNEIDLVLFLEGLSENKKKTILGLMEIDREKDRINSSLSK